jgi:hypothetical protein
MPSRFFWGIGSLWINCTFRLLSRVWGKLQNDEAIATTIVPLWQTFTWWGLFVPYGLHFVEEVVDRVWLPIWEHSIFVPGSSPGGTDVVAPNWPMLTVRVDFSAGGDRRRIPLRKNMCSRKLWCLPEPLLAPLVGLGGARGWPAWTSTSRLQWKWRWRPTCKSRHLLMSRRLQAVSIPASSTCLLHGVNHWRSRGLPFRYRMPRSLSICKR